MKDRFELPEIAEMLPESVLFLSEKGTVLAVNRQSASTLQCRAQDIVGKGLEELVSDPAEKVRGYLRLWSRSRQPMTGELTWRLSNGEELLSRCEGVLARPGREGAGAVILMRYLPQDTATGRVIALNRKIDALSREIRQRQRVEEELFKLASIVESSDDAIIGKDLKGIITSWNQGAERLYGYRAAEVMGRPVSLLSPAERPDEMPEIMKKLRRGEAVRHFETVRVAKDGRLLPVSLTVSPVRDAKGKIIGASTIARDISSRKAAEEAVRRSEKLAVTGRLAATIAHEINNPLEAVTNLLFLAMSELPEQAPAKRYLEAADEELSRVAKIARQTLGFHRDPAGVTTVQVRRLLEELLTLYHSKLRSRRVRVERRFQSEGEIEAAAGEIRQVLANLIANAVDAMPAGGTLWLHLYAGRSWDKSSRPGVRLTIADNGTGILPEIRGRLFEPFFTTKRDLGTGLGLWITRGIVEKHGGSIRLRSSTRPQHSGTVLSLFFPASAGAHATAAD